MAFFGFLNPDFGLDRSGQCAARLRGKQAEDIADLTPYMMATNLFCGIFCFIAFSGSFNSTFMMVWLAALVGVVLLGTVGYLRNKNLPSREFVSRRMIKKATLNAGVLASFWGVLAMIVFPQVEPKSQIVIVAIVSGMMGGGAISLYIIPQALYAWLGVIGAGAVIGLIQSVSPENLAVLGLITVYCAALFKAAHSMSQTYAQRELSTFEVADQAETIGVLLKDFSESTSDWLWELDADGNLLRGASESAEALNIQAEQLDHLFDVNSKATTSIARRSLKEVWKNISTRSSFRDLLISSNVEGESRWVQISGKPVFSKSGVYEGYRGVATDVTQAKRDEERIAFLAHNDALTGLVNRSEFSRYLESRVKSLPHDQSWSVLYLDLDGFKAVNDQHGHHIGDLLLGQVAKRLKNTVRGRDIVARLGGDEFAILCNSTNSIQSATNLAEQLIHNLSESIEVEKINIEIGVSVGIAFAGRDGSTAHEILNNADLALYRAKAEGKGTYRFYEREMDEIVKERRALETDLKSALKNGELSLSFQPLISAVEGKTTGFEALARWHHPERGSVSPSEFIPVAESLGVIGEIGEWVIKSACMEAATWPDHLTIAVNISPQQFYGGNIVKIVADAVEASGIEPSRLEVEITEGLFMDNTELVMEALTQLREIGVSIAMDDFGTGYSSLSYILKFPFDKLKIDRSFVSSIGQDETARNVLEAITKLGDMLNLKVTAEGVETLEQANMLQEMSCTHFQGFYFGKPLPGGDLPAYLTNELHEILSKETPVSDEKDTVLKHSA